MELTSTKTEAVQVDAQSEEWFASYVDPSDDPSNRRHRVRRRRNRHPLHRIRLDTVMMVASVVFIGAMTACFYAVLTR